MSPPVLPDHILKRMSPEDRKSLGRAGMLASEAAAKCVDKSEKAMQAEIQAYCDLRGWPCFRARMDRKSTLPNGTPDFLICLPFTRGVASIGLFVAVECKMKGNKPSREQEDHLRNIRGNHGETMVAYSSHEALQWLKQLAGETP